MIFGATALSFHDFEEGHLLFTDRLLFRKDTFNHLYFEGLKRGGVGSLSGRNLVGVFAVPSLLIIHFRNAFSKEPLALLHHLLPLVTRRIVTQVGKGRPLEVVFSSISKSVAGKSSIRVIFRGSLVD